MYLSHGIAHPLSANLYFLPGKKDFFGEKKKSSSSEETEKKKKKKKRCTSTVACVRRYTSF